MPKVQYTEEKYFDSNQGHHNVKCFICLEMSGKTYKALH